MTKGSLKKFCLRIDDLFIRCCMKEANCCSCGRRKNTHDYACRRRGFQPIEIEILSNVFNLVPRYKGNETTSKIGGLDFEAQN